MAKECFDRQHGNGIVKHLRKSTPEHITEQQHVCRQQWESQFKKAPNGRPARDIYDSTVWIMRENQQHKTLQHRETGYAKPNPHDGGKTNIMHY